MGVILKIHDTSKFCGVIHTTTITSSSSAARKKKNPMMRGLTPQRTSAQHKRPNRSQKHRLRKTQHPYPLTMCVLFCTLRRIGTVHLRRSPANQIKAGPQRNPPPPAAGCSYRLVQAKSQKFSPVRIPLAKSSQTMNIWYHTDPHDQWKRVAWPIYMYIGLGLSLGKKTRIDQ